MSFFLSPFPCPSERIKKPKNNVLGLQFRPLNGLSFGCMSLCSYPEHGRGTGFLGNKLPRSPVCSIWDLQNHCLTLGEARPGPGSAQGHGLQGLSWAWLPPGHLRAFIGRRMPLRCVEFCIFSWCHSGHILEIQIKIRERGWGTASWGRQNAA